VPNITDQFEESLAKVVSQRAMKFEDLRLERAILEIRFPMAYRLWDQAGFLWSTVGSQWPTITNEEANPAKTVFRLELSTIYQLTAEIAAARVVGHYPKPNLEEFTEVVSQFLRIFLQVIDVQTFDRIGFRTRHFFETKTQEEAETLVNDLNLIWTPKGTIFSIEPKRVAAEAIMVLEGDELGARIHIASQKGAIDLTPAPGVPIEPIHLEKFGIVYDVDYFSLAKVSSEQIDFSDWIRNVYHLIKRDSNKVLIGRRT
jgi:hypothetical protein